jgi:ATP-dependent DNA ligase
MRVMCKNSTHLENAAQIVITDGGEGLILQRIGSLYERGRTSSLMKLKVKEERESEREDGIEGRTFVIVFIDCAR